MAAVGLAGWRWDGVARVCRPCVRPPVAMGSLRRTSNVTTETMRAEMAVARIAGWSWGGTAALASPSPFPCVERRGASRPFAILVVLSWAPPPARGCSRCPQSGSWRRAAGGGSRSTPGGNAQRGRVDTTLLVSADGDQLTVKVDRHKDGESNDGCWSQRRQRKTELVQRLRVGPRDQGAQRKALHVVAAVEIVEHAAQAGIGFE